MLRSLVGSEMCIRDRRKACSDEAALRTTAVSQPAILVTSLAAAEQFKQRTPPEDLPRVACGLSLGEYSALAYSGAISFEDAVGVVKARGEAMQEASELVESGMMNVKGPSLDELQGMCERTRNECGGGVLEVANVLSAGNYTVAGESICLKHLSSKLPGAGVTMLEVSGAFHTVLMAPAEGALRRALDRCDIKDPGMTVLSNVTGEAYTTADSVRQLLADQLTSPVQWELCMKNLLESGVTETYEPPPGRVLSAIMKRIHRRIKILK
eukprot:TRINITY_DN44313_c0_g1_i1.p1 TRINITY_DN44313_c0_g1~~TRINITY_DN44313_c0_g1_i1.p1  ORF type:complete len:268 (-),score=57.00 TRINITY_DN44313_c0_g1_i1:73-876(-)